MDSFDEMVEYRNKHNNYAAFLGIRTTEIREGFATGEMPIKEEFDNLISSVHGGSIFSLADTIGGAAAASHGYRMTTVSSDFHFLSAAKLKGTLYATAEEVKYGRHICVYDVSIRDDDEKLIAKGTFSYYNLGEPISFNL